MDKSEGVVLDDEEMDKNPVSCFNIATIVVDMIQGCMKRLVTSVAEKYLKSTIKLEEWVIVELEPEFKLLKNPKSMKNRLWIDIPDSDED